MQSLVLFADTNDGLYPLPSQLDAMNATLAGNPATPESHHKDTTNHIFSILVFQGYLPVENFLSPHELNPKIIADDDYTYSDPPTAEDPAAALWDPAFAADFTSGMGNTSYAHMLPSGERLKLWTSSFSHIHAVVGDRGPEVLGMGTDGSPVLSGVRSNTLRTHTPHRSWSGLIGFGDTHIGYYNDLRTDDLTYTNASGVNRPDTFFFDEPDDPADTNIYLSIFRKAGSEPSDFQAIWD